MAAQNTHHWLMRLGSHQVLRTSITKYNNTQTHRQKNKKFAYYYLVKISWKIEYNYEQINQQKKGIKV